MNAFRHKQVTNYMGHLLVVKAIMKAASIIAAAVTQGDAPNTKDLQDLLQAFKEHLMPETIEEREKKVKRVEEILEREMAQGKLKVKAMSYDTRRKKGLN